MNKKPVMVTTESKGVFFGYLEGEEGENVTLTNVRCCIFWSSAMRGVACWAW